MEQRTQGFSAAVTFCLIGVLVATAWLYKVGKNEERLSHQNEITNPATTRENSSVREIKQVSTAHEPADWDYEVLLNCELVESRTNDGHTFRVLHRGKEYVFRLYFVEALESTLNNPDRIRRQTEYFNYISSEQLLKTGNEARELALKSLRDRPFTVFTQWEKALNSHRYHGFIQLTLPDQSRRFLSEILTHRGFATITAKGDKLPNGVNEEMFRDHLMRLETEAQKAKIGAWRQSAPSRSAHPIIPQE